MFTGTWKQQMGYTERNNPKIECLKNVRFTAGVSQKWKPCGRLLVVKENYNFIMQTNTHTHTHTHKHISLSGCVMHDSRFEEIK